MKKLSVTFASAVLFTTSAMAWEFYQAPASELVTGSVTRDMIDRIVGDPNVYQWGPIRVCKVCAPEPFGSYGGRDRADAGDSDRGGAVSERDASTSSNEPSDSGSPPGGDPGGGNPGRGGECARP